MQKTDKIAHAAKVIALCLPPVVMSLIGLMAMSRRKGAAILAAGKPSTPVPHAARLKLRRC